MGIQQASHQWSNKVPNFYPKLQKMLGSEQHYLKNFEKSASFFVMGAYLDKYQRLPANTPAGLFSGPDLLRDSILWLLFHISKRTNPVHLPAPLSSFVHICIHGPLGNAQLTSLSTPLPLDISWSCDHCHNVSRAHQTSTLRFSCRGQFSRAKPEKYSIPATGGQTCFSLPVRLVRARKKNRTSRVQTPSFMPETEHQIIPGPFPVLVELKILCTCIYMTSPLLLNLLPVRFIPAEWMDEELTWFRHS